VDRRRREVNETEKVGSAGRILSYIREMFISNLSWDTDCLELFSFGDFSQPLQTDAEVIKGAAS
jgi:hypothetical protein